MAKKPAKRARAAPKKRTAKKKAAKPSAAVAAATARARKKFSRDAYARGDAKCVEDGRLEPGATFELHGFDDEGTPIITRRRFKIV
jgi:DNA-nicking Smr family endonuclease